LYVGSPLDGLATDEEFWRAVGKSCQDKALPDVIWSRPESHKRALLRGLWDGDGSWSLVAGGPSVVLEYGTVSRALADGMLRLLGDLGISARLKVGRTAKSTVDTYWLSISGADQIDEALWLFPADEQEVIRASIERQQKRLKPTGYRRLSKNASWVRVSSVERWPWKGTVYSLEVPSAGTIVTTGGLVVHNCFPKDSQALVRIAEEHGYHFELLKGVIAVNEEQFELVASRIERMAGQQLHGVTVGVWGLTFKAGTDDLRDSPAIAVIKRLRAKGAAVQAYDPTAAGRTLPRSVAELGIEVCADPYAACNGAAVLAVLTEWDEFRWLDFGKVAELMDQPAILDGRNLLDPAPLRRRGFQYEGMGRS
jgi:UDPglucose 6-dehydrogenase